MKKKITFFAFAAAFVGALLLMPAVHGAPGNDTAKSLYYSRQSYKHTDSTDQAYELARYASRLDPGNLNAGFYASLYGILLSPDSATFARGRQAMRRYVETYPGDINEAALYAMLCENLLRDPGESARIQERLLRIYPRRTDILMTLAQTYQKLDSIALAVRTVRRYEHAEGQDDNTVTTKASLLLTMGDTAGAIAAVDTLATLRPDMSGTWLLRGSLFDFIGQKDSALVNMRRAEALEPYRFHPKMALSQHYQEAGDTVMADRLMTEALATNDLSVDEKAEGLSQFVSTLYTDSANVARAFPMIEALLAQEPDNTAILRLRAAVEDELKMSKDLEKTMRHILEIEPQSKSIWEQLMLELIEAKDYDAAKKVYDDAVATLEEKDPTLDIYLASAYAIQEKPRQAADMLLQTVRHYLPTYSARMPVQELKDSVEARDYYAPAVANLMQMYGDQFVSLRDTATAFTIYEQVLSIDPENVMTLNNYAYFMALRDSDLDRAAEMSLKTVTDQPDNGTFLDTYAFILFKKGDYERAKVYQEMAIEDTKPEEASAELYNHYGDILFKLGQTRLAVDNWRKALEKEPDNELIKRKIKDETYYDK